MTTLKQRFNIDTAKDATPIGTIAIWSGPVANIPPNWALCDGTLGTPNLTDRFVIGAGINYGVGSIGGSKDAEVIAHTHTGTSDSAGDHGHTASTGSAGNHGHSMGSAGSHRHRSGYRIYASYSSIYYVYGKISGTTGNGYGAGSLQANAIQEWNSTEGSHTHSINSNGAHTHTVTVDNNGAHTHTFTTDSTGVAGTDKNLPPYYALAYIMRTA